MHIGNKMLSESKFYTGYSRWIDSENRYETWDESVSRVMNMHRQKYADTMTPELEELMSFAENAYKEKRVLGAQRALQFGGDQIFKHESRMYNCSVSYVDRPAFFNEAMYLMLSGCFKAGTLVRTENGDKPIEEITPADKILTYNEDEKTFSWVHPQWSGKTISSHKQKVKITFDTHVIYCTADHEFLTENRGWVEAQYLTPDDKIVSS